MTNRDATRAAGNIGQDNARPGLGRHAAADREPISDAAAVDGRGIARHRGSRETFGRPKKPTADSPRPESTSNRHTATRNSPRPESTSNRHTATTNSPRRESASNRDTATTNSPRHESSSGHNMTTADRPLQNQHRTGHEMTSSRAVSTVSPDGTPRPRASSGPLT
ncbi:hypothetical protein FHX82_000719 [Amycolatopsis bartoniae]|uniref:Uncharacterized protein n=1 Tax=Amycolatopsis bartoniae TaxID=941986 RepID=A0A8H9IVU7_9PSEU|nr:hypothetical protein [Amycolatopsis bartoniae]GHF72240.1 hypothetical protein GCM10017566_52640 [Amycolatopsis bartoniae]